MLYGIKKGESTQAAPCTATIKGGGLVLLLTIIELSSYGYFFRPKILMIILHCGVKIKKENFGNDLP